MQTPVSGLKEADLNKILEKYIPFVKREVDKYWSLITKRTVPKYMILAGNTQKRNTNTISNSELYSSGLYGLVQAKYKWDPFLVACSHECRIDPTPMTYEQRLDIAQNGGRCSHGGMTYTFGAFCSLFVTGAIKATIRKSYRKKPFKFTEELLTLTSEDEEQAEDYLRYPTPEPCADGNNFDGSPGQSLSASEKTIIRTRVAAAIASRKVSFPGGNPAIVADVVSDLVAGHGAMAICAARRIRPSAMNDLIDDLRDLLEDYKQEDSGRIWSLPELAAEITSRFPEYPCQPKRLGEWLTRGSVPGTKTPDGRWVISQWGASIAMRKWIDSKRVDNPAEMSLNEDNKRDEKMPKPEWVLEVKDHQGTFLPDYGCKVVIVKIEVGRGRAPSYAVTSSGDRFYGKNREAVLNRFSLKIEEDGVCRQEIKQ